MPHHAIGPLDIVSHTPVWVWLILLLLIWRGLAAAQDREVTAKRMIILPLVIAYLAFGGMVAAAGNTSGFIAVAIGVGLGVLAGVGRFNATGADQIEPGVLRLQGEWVTMITVLSIFGLHYADGVLAVANPALVAMPAYHVVMGGVTAFLAVMTVTLALLRLRLAYAPYGRA